jgi:hypothetical protein
MCLISALFPPIDIFEKYYECYPTKLDTFTAAVGQAFGNLSLVMLLLGAILAPLLSILFINEKKKPKYTDSQIQDACGKVGEAILLVRDGYHNAIDPDGVLFKLNDELTRIEEAGDAVSVKPSSEVSVPRVVSKLSRIHIDDGVSALANDLFTSTDDDHHTVANDDHHTVANDDHHTVANDDHHAVANEDHHAVANDDHHAVANEDHHAVANDDHHAVSNDDHHTVANDDHHTVANEDHHAVANDDHHTVANDDHHTVANEDHHAVANDDHHGVANDDHHTVANEDHHVVANDDHHAVILLLDDPMLLLTMITILYN